MLRLGEFRFLWPWVFQERRAYLVGAGLTVLTSVFLVAVPRLVGEAVGRLQSGDRIDLVPVLALAMVGSVLLRGLTSFYMRTVMIGASRRIEFKLRNHMFRHLENLDAGFFTRTHTGDLMNRFTSDMDAVRATLGPGVMYSLNTLFTLAMALMVMLSVSVALTFYSLIPLALLTVVIRSLGPRVHRESMRVQERLSDVSVHAQENFSNVKVVKAFVREQAEIERMQSHSDALFEQNMRLARLRSLMMGLLWLFGDLVVLCLVGIGGYQILRGGFNLGDFAQFHGCLLLLIWPMIALGWVMTLFQRGAASAERLREILEARPDVNDDRAEAGARVREGRLECQGVSFSYTSETPLVLRDIDFELPAGETLGIVGPTGSGKSTLLRLQPRLHPIETGRIAIDGQRLEAIPLANLRDSLGFVPQEPFLFSATVEENIAFGVSDATPAEIQRVAELVCIHDEIMEFPRGYSQRVGERGITLSGGQKQRLALARTLLKRPRILLLDDVLSAVDAETEARILAGLREWTEDLTTVIVSHRLSAVRHAREILVIEGGAITARGTHRSLVEKPGFYADLHRRQSLEDELENL